MSGGVDSSVTARLLAEKVNNMYPSHTQSKNDKTQTLTLGLRSFCCLHAKLGHPWRIWDGRRMWMEARLGRCATGVSNAGFVLWDGSPCCFSSSILLIWTSAVLLIGLFAFVVGFYVDWFVQGVLESSVPTFARPLASGTNTKPRRLVQQVHIMSTSLNRVSLLIRLLDTLNLGLCWNDSRTVNSTGSQQVSTSNRT